MMTQPTSTARTVFVIAGEHSGDALGASLMAALKSKSQDDIRFIGIGGPLMIDQGLDSLFPMEDLAVMGVFEVLPRLSLLMRRMAQAATEIEQTKPDVVITIDAPDFCFRVIKKIRKRGLDVPVVHYVAPSVWAWRPGRAKKIAKFLDHVLCLLPFEPQYFENEGLAATFVGHPVVAGGLGQGDGKAFCDRHAIARDAVVLCILPGSRRGEVSRLLGVFGEAAHRLKAHHPKLQIVIPSVPHMREAIETGVALWDVETHVVGPDEKADAYSASQAALAASGTVSLELALAKLPHVIAYRMNLLTAFVAKRLVKTPYANLINICLKREAVPELLLENCTPENLTREVSRLLDDEGAKAGQIGAFDEALKQLGYGGTPPGERAADVVLTVMGDK